MPAFWLARFAIVMNCCAFMTGTVFDTFCGPKLPSYCTVREPRSPRFVVMSTTPFAPRVP